MAFSSGTFSLYTPGNPVTTDTTISSTWANNTLNDIATGLTTCVLKDGSQTITANIPFAGYRLTGLGAATAYNDAMQIGQSSINVCEFRLTGTSATPVTTSDVTAIETLYFSPYKGNRCAVYDGSAGWIVLSSAELTLDVPNATNCYDVFVYSNSGTLAIESLAWTNATSRATALTLQNGVLVKTGATTRRYVGTFYSVATGNGQTEDSIAKRYVWNYYNRVIKLMKVVEATDTWSYTTATYRQANNSSANQLDYVQGWLEDPVEAMAQSQARNGNTGVYLSTGIGVDSTTVNSALITTGTTTQVTNLSVQTSAYYLGFPGVGKHTLPWLEQSAASGTTTWVGDDGASNNTSQYGIMGKILG